MPSKNNLEAEFDQLVKAVRMVDQVPMDQFANRLHNKARYNENVKSMFPYFDYAPDYNPLDESDSHSQFLDYHEATNLIARLSISCVGQATMHVEDSLDKMNYKRFIRSDHAEARFGEIITNLMSFCVLEHIDAKLKALDQPSLQSLSQMEGFKDFAIEKIRSARFVHAEVVEDLWRGNHLFTICFLLIVDYLALGPEKIPAYHTRFQDSPSYETLKAWSSIVWNDAAKGNPDKVDTMVIFLGNLTTAVFAPQSERQMAQPTATFDVMKSFYSLVTEQGGEDEEYQDELRASLSRLDNQEEAINEWKSYCETMANFFRINLQPKWERGTRRVFEEEKWDNFHFWMLMSWAHEMVLYVDAIDIRVVPDSPEILNAGDAGSACGLTAGTPILLANGGLCPVGELTSGDNRLHGGPYKPGGSPCKVSTRTAQDVSLVGLNGETPFATDSQVFYTSTGLRAVDPQAAQAANPFQRIGKLVVGHVVYRRSGDGYEGVDIRSIERRPASVQTVYSVSFGGDQQYYHADGYLVTHNDPQQTLQLVAAALLRVPERDRLPLLARYPELSPLFRRHDQGTIKALLNLELSPRRTTSTHRRPTPKANGRGVPLDRIQRQYQLTANDPARVAGHYCLPTVVLIDGRIVMDDQVQLDSSLDAETRTFKWTRTLPQNLFEHGMLRIYHDGRSGHGTVYLTTEANPQQVSKDKVLTFQARAQGFLQPNRRPGEEGYQELDRFKLTLDRSIWPPNTTREKPEDPMPLGEFSSGLYHTGDNATIPYVQFPLLDKLRDLINQKFDKNLDELYRPQCNVQPDGTDRATIQFDLASMIPFVSSSGDNVKVFDVNFDKIGLDLTLPALFQEFHLDMDILKDTTFGALFEYDPAMRGMKGNRHLLQVDYIPQADHLSRLRSKVSRAFAASSDPGSVASSMSVRKPASITDELVQFIDPSIELLLKFPDYNEATVHETSQTYIMKMMYYHMDQEDRKKFTAYDRPTDLPFALREGLPANLQKFFHDKYAPAFLCRSISSFEKYKAKFTDKERKNLWYWWEGNGKNCLAQSEEYNDINNITSIESMKHLYGTQLDPFFNSPEGPVAWAEKLATQLGNRRQLNYFMKYPIQSGGNAINRECCLMNTLAPSKAFANEWFEKIVTYIGKDRYPYIDQNKELAGQWLYDAIHDLVLRVLQDDPKISADVKAQLLKDINDFEIANNLDQTQTAEMRAANFMTKMELFIAEAKNWLTAIGTVLSKAVSGSTWYQFIEVTFRKIGDKIGSRIPGFLKLKRINFICTTAIYVLMVLGNVAGLVLNWDKMTADQRATAILATLKIAVEGAHSAIDAFKKAGDKPMTEPADQIELEDLSQSTSRAIEENSHAIGEMSEEINGPGGFHDSVANHVGPTDGTPIESPADEQFNQKMTDPIEDLPAGSKAAAEKFGLSGSILKGLNIALGLGVAVAMTFTLAREWDRLTDVGKVINTLAVVVQVLTVVLDVVEVVTTFLAVEVLAAALPIIGAVLAVIGFVLMLFGFFMNLYKSNPPPDPVADYINDKGRPVIAGFDEAREPQLTYTISHDKVTPGQVTTITIEAANRTGQDVSMTNARVTMLSGNDDTALFAAEESSPPIVCVLDTDPDREKENHTYVAPGNLVDANLPPPSKLGTTSIFFSYDLRVAGPKRKEGGMLQELVLKPSETLRSVWTALINKNGSDEDHTTSYIDIVELANNDKSHVQFSLLRAN